MNLNRLSRSANVLAAVLCLVASHAQAAPLTVKSLNYKGTMPYVVSDSARLAQRINNLIYLDMLDLAAPIRWQDGLRERKKEEGMEPTSDISFTVKRNDSRLLVLSISAEGCGAYCEHYTRDFNFDAASGRQVLATDLFTPSGANEIFKRLESLSLARIRAEIAKLRGEAKKQQQKAAGAQAPAPDGEDESRADDAIEMYQQCVASLIDPEMARYRNIESHSMKIGTSSVIFTRGRCSNHASRALDDIGEIENVLSFKDLAPHFSEYGKALLSGNGQNADKAIPAGGPFDQVLTGRIGNAPITLRLRARSSDGSVSGAYFYDKYRTPISLFGKVIGNTLTMEETDSKDKVLPVIRATIAGESLKGQWIGGGKQIAFEVAP